MTTKAESVKNKIDELMQLCKEQNIALKLDGSFIIDKNIHVGYLIRIDAQNDKQ